RLHRPRLLPSVAGRRTRRIPAARQPGLAREPVAAGRSFVPLRTGVTRSVSSSGPGRRHGWWQTRAPRTSVPATTTVPEVEMLTLRRSLRWLLLFLLLMFAGCEDWLPQE